MCEGHDSYNICFNDYTSHNDYHIHGAINDCTVRKNHIHSPRMPSPPLYLFPFFPCLFLHLCLSFSLSLSASVSFLLSLTLFVIGDTYVTYYITFILIVAHFVLTLYLY